MYDAESKSQKVVFLTHIPFSDETGMATLGKFVKALFRRFEHTIEISLAAHTHNDTVSFYTDKAGEPMFLELTSPSLTTYSDLNPSFRVYEMDLEGRIVDFAQWRMNLDVLNVYAAQGNLVFWFDLVYRFGEEYGVDLAGQEKRPELARFEKKLHRDNVTLRKYTKNYLTLYKLRREGTDLVSKMEEVKCLMLDQADLIHHCIYQNGGNFLDYLGSLVYRKFFERTLWLHLKKNN